MTRTMVSKGGARKCITSLGFVLVWHGDAWLLQSVITRWQDAIRQLLG
jgi:hypothetical protein